MATKLKDIAEKLNISVSTVSRVLNNRDRVDVKTQQRVKAMIKQLNYYPNGVARSLKSGNSEIFGIVVPDISNQFYASVIKGLGKKAQQSKYSVFVCNSNGEIDMEEKLIQFLLQKQVSGLAVATVGGKANYFKQCIENKIPIIFFDNYPIMCKNCDYITIDNEKIAEQLTNHLLALKHEKIAIITGSQNETSNVERLHGWKTAMALSGRKIDENDIYIGKFSLESGYEQMTAVLKSNEKYTAVLATDNYLAYGAIRAIQESGLKIPEDIAIVCFDAKDETELIRPQITSFIQPAEEIGSIAAELLIRRINNSKSWVFHKVILEPEFIIKQSCGYYLTHPKINQ